MSNKGRTAGPSGLVKEKAEGCRIPEKRHPDYTRIHEGWAALPEAKADRFPKQSDADGPAVRPYLNPTCLGVIGSDDFNG